MTNDLVIIGQLLESLNELSDNRGWFKSPTSKNKKLYINTYLINGEIMIGINSKKFNDNLLSSIDYETIIKILKWVKEWIIKSYPQYKNSGYKIFLLIDNDTYVIL